MRPGPVWVTGATGLIGSHLLKTAADAVPDGTIRGLSRAQVDLTDPSAVITAFHADEPRMVIHCAALSRGPDCQADPALARRLNIEATARLAELAADIPFIFFSSDLVFDGEKGQYDESDPVNPRSVYAETKAEAERIVLVNPGHLVIRTSLNGGVSPAGHRCFSEEMRDAWGAGRSVRLFTDEYRSPIPAAVTARAVWELARRYRPGLYHLAGKERLSRWAIGQLIAARSPQLNPRLESASLRDYAGPPRSPDTSLNCAKVQRLLSFPLPGLSEWLSRHPDEPF